MPAQSDRAPFPFIVGCDRSGTTLLRAIVASHPLVSIPDESYFIVSLIRRLHIYQRKSGFAAERFLHELSYERNYRRWSLSHENVVRAFQETPPHDFAAAIRTVYAVFASAEGKERYGDKTPVYVMHMDKIARLFPEAVFIHVVRDARDVALSLIEHRFELPRDVGQAAVFWCERVRTGRRLGAALGGRYLEIRYEDLLSDPQATLEAVCDHAQLPFDEEILGDMLRYPERAQALVENAANPSAHQNIRNGLTKGLRDWRERLREPDRLLIEAIAVHTLRAGGYPVSAWKSPALPLSVRTGVASSRLRWFVRSRVFLGLLRLKFTVSSATMTLAGWSPLRRGETGLATRTVLGTRLRSAD